MTPPLKTYLLVFIASGLTFSALDAAFTYIIEHKEFNLMRSLFDVVLFGAVWILVYYITVVLPKKNNKPSVK